MKSQPSSTQSTAPGEPSVLTSGSEGSHAIGHSRDMLLVACLPVPSVQCPWLPQPCHLSSFKTPANRAPCRCTSGVGEGCEAALPQPSRQKALPNSGRIPQTLPTTRRCSPSPHKAITDPRSPAPATAASSAPAQRLCSHQEWPPPPKTSPIKDQDALRKNPYQTAASCNVQYSHHAHVQLITERVAGPSTQQGRVVRRQVQHQPEGLKQRDQVQKTGFGTWAGQAEADALAKGR